MTYRDQGKNALRNVLNKEQNIRVVENNIYNISVQQTNDLGIIEDIYKEYLYQVIGDILNGENLQDILSNIRKSKLGWDHHAFIDMKNRIEEQDNFIENPFEVAEGISECKAIDKNTGKKCGSKRVLSYNKMTRSCDEPMTTFSTCCACGAKWSYSG